MKIDDENILASFIEIDRELNNAEYVRWILTLWMMGGMLTTMER